MPLITLTEYRPVPRYAPVVTPWTAARIEESVLSTGPWTEVDTVALDPVDADPTQPEERGFTVVGTVDVGYYRVVFLDDEGREQFTPPEAYPPAAVWAPTLDEVAALLHPRTAVMGTERNHFDDATTPTASQVHALIALAVADVESAVGITIPEKYTPDARALAAVRAAAKIESSYFPKEIDTDRSAYRQLTAQYLSGIESLSARISRALIIQ